jgi:hypothetical protein
VDNLRAIAFSTVALAVSGVMFLGCSKHHISEERRDSTLPRSVDASARLDKRKGASRTEEEQVAAFLRYFSRIDALRGDANDHTLVSQFRGILMRHDWSKDGVSRPPQHSVACGNSYCRINVVFGNRSEAERTRVNLWFELSREAKGGASMFFDPATKSLQGYFGVGVPLPEPEEL